MSAHATAMRAAPHVPSRVARRGASRVARGWGTRRAGGSSRGGVVLAAASAGPARSRPPRASPAPHPGDVVVPEAFRYAPSAARAPRARPARPPEAASPATASARWWRTPPPRGDVSPDVPVAASASAIGGVDREKKKLRVAYQGMPGAYSEAAALTAYPNCEPCPCEQFENAFEATEQWNADRAVLPFENSLGGSIHRNYDLILNHRLHIVGEVYFKVRHCLLALPGQDKADIVRAHVSPAGARAVRRVPHRAQRRGGQGSRGRHRRRGGVHRPKTPSPASPPSPPRAADLYGMEVYDSDIQDDKSNVTRFLALAREPLPPRPNVPYKTSIAFSMKETSGSLFKALACFALRDINLTKVESRPMRWNPVTQSAEDGTSMQFSYLFYVDFSASMADENAQNALRQLQENATFLRVLGSYPADDSRL